jgi:inorganic pyrophosphatase
MNLIDKNIGDNFPDIVNAIVEISKDSSAKYEYCPKMEMLRLDRCLISSMRYPASYGFIPQTLSGDGDPLDILIHNTVPLEPLSYIEVRPIGALITTDNDCEDCKILGIPLFNPNDYNDIDQVDPNFLDICEDFFRHYKNNNRSRVNRVKVIGWENSNYARELIIKTHRDYLNNKKSILLD